jgi:hypothetical protein
MNLSPDEIRALQILRKAQSGAWTNVPEVIWAQSVLREGRKGGIIYAM